MLLIRCPYCEEERPEIEFRHAGEAHIERPQNIADIPDAEFESYFFIRENARGVIFERWRHIHGCARFFNAARHSVSDTFIVTYRAGEPKPALTDEQIDGARARSRLPARGVGKKRRRARKGGGK
jgi:sarcosine oxidase subunit delta